MPLNPASYLHKTRFFFPQIDIEGHCAGHAYLGMHALTTFNLPRFDIRLESIILGVPTSIIGPGRFSRLRLSQLEDLTERFNLEERVKKILSETQEDTNDVIPDTPSADDRQSTLEQFIERFIKLINVLGVSEVIPSLSFLKTNPPGSETKDDSNEVSAQELKKEIDLAWAIRKAFWERKYEEYNAEAIKELGIEKAKLISEKMKHDATYDLRLFDSYHPYLLKLIDLEIYFSNIALYQAPQRFPFLFEKHKKPKQQKLGLFVPLLSPVELDGHDKDSSGIKKLADFTLRYNLEKLQVYFDSLAGEINADSMRDNGEKKKLLAQLPLALIFSSEKHAITFGYNIKNAKWILVDSGQPPSFEIEQKDIAEQVILALSALDRINISSTNSYVSIAFDKRQNEWVLVDAKQSATPKEELFPDHEKLIQALIKSPHLKNIKDFMRDSELMINTKVYASNKYMLGMDSIISTWQKTKAFKELNQFTSEDINVNYKINESLLYFACSRGDLDTVKRLIQAKADVNQTSLEKDDPPLVGAIIHDQIEILRFLIEHKANPNQPLPGGSTPLLVAAEANQAEMIDILIQAGADINAKLENGTSALEIAIKQNHPAVVKMLLKHGAKSDLTEYQNIEESSIYQKNKNNKIAKILKEYYQAYMQNKLQQETLNISHRL